jgi:hypothetical protein
MRPRSADGARRTRPNTPRERTRVLDRWRACSVKSQGVV